MKTTMKSLSLSLLAAAMVLAGCASPGSIAPQAKLHDSAAELGLSSSAAPAKVDATWWTAFNDPQLNALVDKALADNANLRVAAARIERATAVAESAGAADKPNITADVELQRQHLTENYIYPPPLGGSNINFGNAELQGSWEFDFFGRNRAALEAAIGSERSAEAERDAARVALASNVARSYFQLARLGEQKKLAERTLAQRDELLKLIRQRVDAGLDTNVELRQGEGSIPEARAQLEALDEQMSLTRHALAVLTSQPPNALDALAPSLQPVQAIALPAVLPLDLVGQRADVAAARWRVEAATQDLKSARASFYPNISLTAMVGLQAIGFNNLIDAGSRNAAIGPAISLPVFDAGRLRANYHGKAADVDAAVESYNLAVLDAVREAADQISSSQSITRQQRQQDEAQAAAESAYDLATQRYKAGLGTYLTVLTAETNVIAQRRATADLKARALDTQVALARALGGGYTARPPTSVAVSQSNAVTTAAR